MAVSPNVDAYMATSVQQAPMQTAEDTFIKEFGNQAFNAFRAKYPALADQTITFRTLDSDMDTSTAFGVFIVQSGSDVVYIPCCMAGGSITSCEMAYDKVADQFYPLTKDNVREILAAGAISDASILTKSPRVDDTRALFHNMTRPPVSSNVILASGRSGAASLPNRYKEVLAHWLEKERPDVLGKIASFYPVEELAHKLAKVVEQPQVKEASLPSFLRLDALTPAIAEKLDARERAGLLNHGFITKTAGESPTAVVPFSSLSGQLIETELNLTVYTRNTYGNGNTSYDGRCADRLDRQVKYWPVMRACAVGIGDAGLDYQPCLVCGPDILLSNGYVALNHTQKILLHDLCNAVSWEFLDKYGYVFPGSRLGREVGKLGNDWAHLHVIVPSRNGFTFLDLEECFSVQKNSFHIQNIGEDIVASFGDPHSFEVRITPRIQYGWIKQGDMLAVPQNSRFFLSTAELEHDAPFLASPETLKTLLVRVGKKLVVSDNGAGIDITDHSIGKTASFACRTDAAAWLHGTYGMDAGQARKVLDAKQSLVLSKTAFEAGQSLPDMQAVPQQMPVQGSMEMPVPGYDRPAFDPSVMEQIAEIEDPELMDTGILATFAQNPDIKTLLVDYLPDFISAQDRLGRIILMLSYQKKELQDFFGTEKHTTLLSSCRKIFTVIGDLVTSLKQYVNMA